MSDSTLFDAFPKISSEEWKDKIRQDLKGADYDEALIWYSPEGIAVQPFYQSENGVSLEIKKKDFGWTTGHLVHVEDQERATTNAKYALERGAESIWFVLPSNELEAESLLDGMDSDEISAHLELRNPTGKLVDALSNVQKSSDTKIKAHIDPIGNLLRTGDWVVDQKKDLETLFDFRNVMVDTSIGQNAGATIVQQLAFALAHANEYLHFNSVKLGGSIDVGFKVSVGTNYFFEIAKLRALRLLWATLAQAYGVSENCFIMAMPTKRNKTLYDYNVNMLRTTSECMSAVLGGADLLCNQPYDAIYHNPNEFGDRIALNQLLLLKYESYFDKVDNAAEGSYYIEALTNELAGKALEFFKEIEKAGGFLEQLKAGVIQDQIQKSAALEQERLKNGEDILVGTNKVQNEDDKMRGLLEVNPFYKKNFKKTFIRPLVEKRLAEEMEQKRLGDE